MPDFARADSRGDWGRTVPRLWGDGRRIPLAGWEHARRARIASPASITRRTGALPRIRRVSARMLLRHPLFYFRTPRGVGRNRGCLGSYGARRRTSGSDPCRLHANHVRASPTCPIRPPRARLADGIEGRRTKGVLLICTGLPASDRRHAQLDAALQEDHGTNRILGSTWAVFTNDPPARWYARARRVLGPDHPVLVVALMSSFAGYLPEKAMAWLDRHLGPARA